jgi:CubicO group peptidase (beta-lactamase class C family)
MGAMKDDQRKKWEQLSLYVQDLMETNNVPGVSIGIIKSGELFSEGFGVTSVENPLPVTNSTLFQIGSITKTFTSTAIMRLVEMGKIELDAPVQTYCPAFKVGDEETSSKATIRHLLTHTSGWIGDFFIDTGSGDDAMAKYAERMAELDQISPAGSIISYNNSGFYLLGYIIELIMKTPYEEAVRDLVIDPLGIEKCLFNPGDVMLNRFSVGHRVVDGVAEVASPWALPRAAYPAGGIVCNVDGLLQYAKFHLEGGVTCDGEQILETEITHTMQTPQEKYWGDEEFIGLSWFINIENGTKIISHSGGTVGQGAILQFVPDHEFAIAILTNADTGAQLIESTLKWCLREYIGIESEDPKPLNVSRDSKQECEGRYVLPRLGYVDIHLRGEKLIAQEVPTGGFPTEDTPPAPARPPYTLTFIEEDRLVVLDGKIKGEKFELIRDTTGAIKWLRKGSRLHIKESIGG